MSELYTMKSMIDVGCELCDTCCKYRGDIRVTIKNIHEISRFMGLTPIEFLENYTHEIEGQKPERALNAVGEYRECILYDTQNKKCSVNSVKPLQCVVFPLFPEDVKNDYFSMLDQCKCKHK